MNSLGATSHAQNPALPWGWGGLLDCNIFLPYPPIPEQNSSQLQQAALIISADIASSVETL